MNAENVIRMEVPMSRTPLLTLLVALVLMLPNLALADPPSLSFGYTGVLVGEAEWWQQSLSVDLEFRLCASGVEGEDDCAWQQAIDAWPVEGGHFTVELGGEAAPLAAVDLEGPRWLEVSYGEAGGGVGDWVTLSPRVKVAAVPLAALASEAEHAATADDAGLFGGKAPDAYATHDHPHSDYAATSALSDALAGKADVGHGHIGVYAPVSHTHALVDLDAAGCVEGQVVKWFGGAWSCGDDLQGGSGGQEYEAGAGLTLTGATFSLDAAQATTVLSGWDQDASDDLTTSAVFGGDVSGIYDALALGADTVTGAHVLDGSLALSDLGGAACTGGQVAKWSGTVWACAPDVDTDTQLDEAAVDAFVENNGYAAAGHDHAALYVDEGQADSISGAMLQDSSVDGAKVTDGSLGLDDMGDAGCADGQVAKWIDGTGTWSCANDLQGGSGGQEYEAGAGLTLTEATFSLDAVKATTVLSGWDQDGSDDLTTSAVFGGDVSGSYDALALGADTVTGTHVSDGSLSLADLGGADCTEGQVAKWIVGTETWTCGDDLQGGSGGQEYEAGAGLTLTGATFSLDAAQATTVLLGWDQDASDDLTMSAVFGGDVSGSYDGLVLGSDTVTGAHVSNGSLSLADLGGADCTDGQMARWDAGVGAWACEGLPAGSVDTLAALSCDPGEVAKWSGGVWACSPDADTNTQIDEAAVDAFVENNGYADAEHAHAWSAITDKPSEFPSTAHAHDDLYYPKADTDLALSGKADQVHGHAWADLSGIPTDLADGDDDTTYSGADFATSLQACPAGQFAVAIDLDGFLECESSAGGLPSDGLGVVSNGTLTNALSEEYAAVGLPTGIGEGVDVEVVVGDAGTLRDLSVTVAFSHPYCIDVEVRLLPPGDATGLKLVAAGDESGTNCTYEHVFGWDEALPDGAWLSDWEGRELAGTWTLRVTDTEINGNETAGLVTDFGLDASWLSSEALWALGDVRIDGALQACDGDVCGRFEALEGDLATYAGELSTQAGSIESLEQDHDDQAALIGAQTSVNEAQAALIVSLQADLWCMRNCDPERMKDCRQRNCDGTSQSCPDAGAQADGTFCVSGGKAGACLSGACCVAETCASASAQCGSLSDGCGAWLTCGHCQLAEAVCVANQCCVPATCASLGKDCGDWDDGCGGMTGDCGSCGSGYTCDAGVCSLVSVECGGVACPELSGYEVSCNGSEHCEYANVDVSGWKAWDEWIYVPPGSFDMGSPSSESSNADEKDVHPVTIGTGYFIAKYEIPVLAYEACESAGSCTAPSTADWDVGGGGRTVRRTVVVRIRRTACNGSRRRIFVGGWRREGAYLASLSGSLRLLGPCIGSTLGATARTRRVRTVRRTSTRLEGAEAMDAARAGRWL
jgi:subtilisin-like proprotein convertase family protein